MNVTFDFKHQNFLITGASSGIGRETAKELLQAGGTVLGMARHFPKDDELVKAFPDRWVPMITDVTQFDMLEQSIENFVEQYGKLNGCVHSAGMAMLLPINVWNHEISTKMMDVNLWAGEALLKIFWKEKYRNGCMAHVFISSISAHSGQKGLSSYAASKAGLEAVVRTAAKEMAGRGNVNSVCLGWIETKMTRSSESQELSSVIGNGTEEDAAGMILYLLSNRAQWITGANFVVDGGYLA